MKRVSMLVVLTLVIVLLGAAPVFAQSGRFVLGGNVDITAADPVNGDLVVVGGNVNIHANGFVSGNVVIVGGNVQSAGTVMGNVTIFGGNFTLTSGGVVNGSVTRLGGNLNQSPGAQIRGGVDTNVTSINFGGPRGWIGWGAGTYGSWLFTAILAVLVVVFFPRGVGRAQQTLLVAPWASLGLGFVILVAVVAVGIVLLFTICLIPISILLWLAAWVASIFGLAAVSAEVGTRILHAFGSKGFAVVWAVLLGAFVLVIVSWVPCIGWLIGFATTCVSLGVAVLSRMGTHVYGTVPVATPPAPPAPPAPPEPPAA